MLTVSSSIRIASTAAWSAAFLSPRPIQRAEASAAYSVVRTSSSARLRSGRRPSAVVPAAASVAVRPSIAGKLQDAWRLIVAVAGLAQVTGRDQPAGSDQPDEVPDLERDGDLRRRLAQDDPVAEDQDDGSDAGDCGDLARSPGEGVPAGDDPREDER